MVRDHDSLTDCKYKLVVDTQILGLTTPGQWGTLSFNWFGDSSMTDEVAIQRAQEIIMEKRLQKPEAKISGSLFELKKLGNSRGVANFEHPNEQPA